jgi:hypothetical protein
MKKERKQKSHPQVGSSEWVGESPPLSEAANGWWWLWNDGAWCAAAVEYIPDKLWGEPSLRVSWIRWKGGMSSEICSLEKVAGSAWGGRMSVPGDSPTDGSEPPFPARKD